MIYVTGGLTLFWLCWLVVPGAFADILGRMTRFLYGAPGIVSITERQTFGRWPCWHNAATGCHTIVGRRRILAEETHKTFVFLLFEENRRIDRITGQRFSSVRFRYKSRSEDGIEVVTSWKEIEC